MKISIQPVHMLPPSLGASLGRLRRRYGAALRSAGAGDFSHTTELQAVSRSLGRLLAQEAKKSQIERGGICMLDLSLAVDRLFPEMRGWIQHDLLQRRLRPALVAIMGLRSSETVRRKGRAS